MYFGKPSYRTQQRGVSTSLKRQLLLLVGVLVGVVFMGLQFYQILNRRPEPTHSGPTGKLPGFGDPIEAPPTGAEESAVTLPPPAESQPPEPFEEKPDVLARGAKVDKTGRFDETLIAYLLQKVRTRGKDLYVDTPELSHEIKRENVWKQIYADPEKYRGRLVEVKGVILSPEPGRPALNLRGIDFPNPSGIDRAFMSYMLGVDDKYYMVATARKQRDLPHREGVRLRGYFCQLYTYPVELQGEVQWATIPLLVGDDYELLDRPRTTPPWTGDYIPLLAALGVFTLVFVLAVQGRSQRHYQERLLQAKQKQRERGSHEADSMPQPQVPTPGAFDSAEGAVDSLGASQSGTSPDGSANESTDGSGGEGPPPAGKEDGAP